MLANSARTPVIVSTIRESGIAFDATPQVIGELRKKGADKAVVAALHSAAHATMHAPLNDSETRMMLATGVSSENIARAVAARSIDFQPSESDLDELRSEGASDDLVEALRSAKPRAITHTELTQWLNTHVDQAWMVQQVRARAVDFDAATGTLQALREAGAHAAFLQAVPAAQRVAPAALEALPPSKPSDSPEPGRKLMLACDTSEQRIPVLSDPSDTGSSQEQLPCDAGVTFPEKVESPPGFSKIQYGDGKVGFISNFYLAAPITRPLRNIVPPTSISRPEPPYTLEAQRDGLQGSVNLWIVIDENDDGTDVREVSRQLGDGLDKSAMDTVKTWKFNPATRNGVPIAVRVAVDIDFRLAFDRPAAN